MLCILAKISSIADRHKFHDPVKPKIYFYIHSTNLPKLIRKLLTTCCFRCKYDLKVMYALLFWNELCLHKIGAILWKGSCIAFVYVCYLRQRRVNFCTVLADSTKKISTKCNFPFRLYFYWSAATRKCREVITKKFEQFCFSRLSWVHCRIIIQH